jgi:cytidylate kinase
LRAGGTPAIYEVVLQERDARDARRQAAPLAAARGAVIIDTTTLDADMVLARAADIIERTLASSR